MGSSEWQIAEQSGVLQRQTSTVDGVPEVDLHPVGSTWRKLGRTARVGREAHSTHLTDGERAAHRSVVRHYHTALEERQRQRDAALAAARTLARTEGTDPAHLRAAHDFEMRVQREKAITESLTPMGDRAACARVKLREDDTSRAAKKLVVKAGAEAEKQLEGLMRGSLAEAVHTRALLPSWFVKVLGPAPPAKKTQSWMDLAVRVLVYRAVYETADPVLALGARPAHDASVHLARYEELTQALRHWS